MGDPFGAPQAGQDAGVHVAGGSAARGAVSWHVIEGTGG